MSISKESVVEALKQVLYFPKGDNVVALNMISEMKVSAKKVSFSINFSAKDEKSENVVKDSCIKVIKKEFGDDLNIDVTIKTPGSHLKKIKNIIAIASGKGGVGKSTISANLAVALSKTGAKTGIIDADIYGPSIPIMFNVQNAKPHVIEKNGKTWILPVENYGVKILSVGFFVDPGKALIWRGPMASNALLQLFNDSDWGDLDYLVIDLPPGTGDVHLTLAQEIPVTGIAIVTTPQEVALADARKAFSMFNQKEIRIPLLGLIENMSYFTPAELPDKKYYIFGKNGGSRLAKDSGVPMLGEIPLVESICESGDKGTPSVLDEDSVATKAFNELTKNIINRLKEIKE